MLIPGHMGNWCHEFSVKCLFRYRLLGFSWALTLSWAEVVFCRVHFNGFDWSRSMVDFWQDSCCKKAWLLSQRKMADKILLLCAGKTSYRSGITLKLQTICGFIPWSKRTVLSASLAQMACDTRSTSDVSRENWISRVLLTHQYVVYFELEIQESLLDRYRDSHCNVMCVILMFILCIILKIGFT